MTHNIIKTENYLLVVDDSEIKEGDYHVAIRIVKTHGDKAIAFTDQEQLDAIAEIGGAKKIIAHLPLNNSLILQGVDLLPPLEQEDDVEELAPKMPIGFECEDEYVHDDTVPYPKTLGTHPKTIVNPQGQTVLVGKYIY